MAPITPPAQSDDAEARRERRREKRRCRLFGESVVVMAPVDRAAYEELQEKVEEILK